MESRVLALSSPHTRFFPFHEISISQSSHFDIPEFHLCQSCTSPEDCFTKYLAKTPLDYLIEYLDSPNPFLNLDLLPGKAPIIDHLCTMMKSQPISQGGGNWAPFLENSINRIRTHRSISLSTPLKTTNLVFTRSTKSEVVNFLKDFNTSYNNQSTPELGNIPVEFFSINVEYFTSAQGLFILDYPESTIFLDEPKVPAVISLSLLNKRYDIVIPWIYTAHNKCFTLSLANNIPLFWNTIFSKISGYAICLNPIEIKDNLTSFFASCNQDHGVSTLDIKFVELDTILSFGGLFERVDLAEIAYIMVGTFPFIPSTIATSLQPQSLSTTPKLLSLVIETKANCILNAAITSSIHFLLQLFPTPGIAAIVSGKEPHKFLLWFSRFLTTVSLIQPNNLPNYQIENFQFNNKRLIDIYPLWSFPYHGGCPTDLTALHHLLYKVHPLVSSKKTPWNLRWSSNPTHLYSLVRSPSGKTKSDSLLGCLTDEALPCLNISPDMLSPTTPPIFTLCKKLNQACRESLDSDLHKNTTNQTMMVILWTNPILLTEMFLFTSGIVPDRYLGNMLPPTVFIQSKDMHLTAPVISSYLGKPLAYPMFYEQHLSKKYTETHSKRLQILKNRLPHALDPTKIKKSIKTLEKLIKIHSKHVLTTKQLNKNTQDSHDPYAAFDGPENEDMIDLPSLGLPPEADPYSVFDDPTDILIIDTPDLDLKSYSSSHF